MIPSAPEDFKPDDWFEGTHWHQRWECFQGIYTPGINSVEKLCQAVGLPEDLTAKRVLDIGAWNGCFSFECERRGAAEVIACSLENPDRTGFNRLKKLLNSRVRYVQDSVYALDPETLGTFDVILFFGVLYHLRYPLLAIDRIRTVAHGDVYVETHVAGIRDLVRQPLTLLGNLMLAPLILSKTPIWRQYGPFELTRKDQSNWFGPNVAAVLEGFDSAGFDIRHRKSWSLGGRAAFTARVRDSIPERLVTGSYEGASAFNAHLAGVPLKSNPFFAEDSACVSDEAREE